MNIRNGMPGAKQMVPLQSLPPWGANDVLSAHLGTIDYHIESQNAEQLGEILYYRDNKAVWEDTIRGRITSGFEICLDRFMILDWFPRSPGLYYTPDAEWARQEAFQHLHSGVWNSPIRNHTGQDEGSQRPLDYTVVFTPMGKSLMLDGGIGCIRLKPIQLSCGPHWFMTATSDGVVHSGFPIAVPFSIYRRIYQDIQIKGAVCSTVRGILEIVPNPFSRLFSNARMVPRLYLRLTDYQPVEPQEVVPEVSVAVSFVSKFEGRPNIYATYVTFRADLKGSFDEGVAWMKNEYVEGEYQGKIITDFDQTRTIFPEAQLALAKVLDRTLSHASLVESIELMHAAASANQYFQELDLRQFLSERTKEQRKKIFISYSHEAEEKTHWVKGIKTHLEGLVRSTDFEVWADSRIEPGQQWKDEILRAIEQTRVAILVLTADFINSAFIRESELPLLLEAANAGGTTIFCLYGSSVFLSGVTEQLKKYQFVNDLKKPLQSLSEAELSTFL